MGIFRVDFSLANAAQPDREEQDVRAVVDTGAMHLCITPLIAKQLGFVSDETGTVRVADGRLVEAPYVGPIRLQIMGRHIFTGALVLDGEPLLGAIPLEDLDLHVDPQRMRLIPNPESPDRPMSLAVGVLPAKRDEHA